MGSPRSSVRTRPVCRKPHDRCGRIGAPLVGLGHAVVGIDDSPEMLAAMDPSVEAVLADARTVRLGRRFDAVLLASHLLNDPDADAFLATPTPTSMTAG